jgi:hypothetical protein
MNRPLAITLVAFALTAASCSGGQGSPAPALVQRVDVFGPTAVGPSLLAGASVQELKALVIGAGGDCPSDCWSGSSDPAAAYLALIATAPCEDRDLATSLSGSALTITVTWKSTDCRGVAVRSTLDYSLFSVLRGVLPAGPVRVKVRYLGQTAYPGPQAGETLLDLSTPPDPALERAAVAAAVDSARVDAGVGPARDVRLVALYRRHCQGGVDSYVVSLARARSGAPFTGQYVAGSPPPPEQGCPAP